MRGDREQRARVIGQRRAPLSSSAMRPPARRAAECGGARRGADTVRGDEREMRRGTARREVTFVYLSPCNALDSRSVTRAGTERERVAGYA